MEPSRAELLRYLGLDPAKCVGDPPELRAQLTAKDVQEIPSPPLGRELGRSPIPTPRRQERETLLSIVRASCEVDTVRKAALALLGEVQP